MVSPTTNLLLALLLPALSTYLYLLHKRLTTGHPSTKRVQPLSTKELDAVSYADVDMLKGIPPTCTGANYAIIGGSGFVGTYLIRLLLLRGETSIRILDLHHPDPAAGLPPTVDFLRADITSPTSIREALLAPFPGNDKPADVIYLTAALIRIWERAAYTYPLSFKINVEGTRNVIDAVKAIPNAILIYTGTADVLIPRPRFARLGYDYNTPPWNTSTISDADPPLDPHTQLHDSTYARSKAAGEGLVLAAHTPSEGLRTGVIRPGCTILGPNDRLITSTLMMPRVPVFDAAFAHTNVCVWDVVAAHLLLEDALRKRGADADVGGQAFLVTGEGGAWTLRDTRNTVKHYSRRDLIFDPVPPLLIYLLAHVVEALLYLRFYLLSLFFADPSVTPRWLGQVTYLQPATLAYMADTVIDDGKARRVLGYRPQWATTQVIRHTVGEMEKRNGMRKHGLEMK